MSNNSQTLLSELIDLKKTYEARNLEAGEAYGKFYDSLTSEQKDLYSKMKSLEAEQKLAWEEYSSFHDDLASRLQTKPRMKKFIDSFKKE